VSEAIVKCPNCGAARAGKFCGNCGQNDRSYLRGLGELASDFFEDVFGLDTRLARTLHGLLLRPGALTVAWCSNRRAHYVSPVRLYLVISILFFSVLSLGSRLDLFDFGPEYDADASQFDLGDPEYDRVYRTLNEEQRRRLNVILEKRGLATGEVRAHLEQLAAESASEEPLSALESALHDRALDFLEDPRAVWNSIISDLPLAMFLALPLFAAWLKVMYRRRFYAEHLVFALHLHAFLFAVGTLLLLLPNEADAAATGPVALLTRGTDLLESVLYGLAGIYYAFAMHRVYGERWPHTLGKFLIVNVVHVFVIVFGISAATALALVL
jgi:hypothetical protein